MILLLMAPFFIRAQRQYSSSSVLSAGNWYKISISRSGIYKVDAAFLAAMGIGLPVPSASIRLYGNGGQMLPEANALARPDDLMENAIWVQDGGDGNINDGDYFLFYAPGPHGWVRDSANSRFRYIKNLYADSSWYFITIGGQGKRVGRLPDQNGGIPVNSFDDYYAHALDSINFLSSGKEWYGEEFGTGPGRVPARDFDIPVSGLIPNTPVTLYTDVLARAVGQYSRFEVRLNRNLVQNITMAPLPGVAYEPVATPGNQVSVSNLAQPSLQVSFQFFPGSVNGQGWLNGFELNFRRSLDLQGLAQLPFRDMQSVASGQKAEFTIINGGNSIRVWDVTNPQEPAESGLSRDASAARFSNDCSVLHEYISFTDQRYLIPLSSGKVANQDLHRPRQPQLLIITHRTLLEEADRLGQLHRQRDNLDYTVANVDQVYNEFSSGSPDPAALRDYVKMFYDRAGTDTARRPRYLLLFGDGSFDYKNRIAGNKSLVPAYQSPFSLDPLTSYTSDDFFGLLGDADDVNSFTPASDLDIGIGRIPASSPAEARAYVDKLQSYYQSFGPWRNMLSFVADDEDQNIHFNDAEAISATARTQAPQFNTSKIYLDAYPQEGGTGGSRYPQVNEAITRRIYSGNLIWNYNGHGGSSRLAEEDILDQDMVNSWSNDQKLPLFITATCDFAPFDNPLVASLGENILLRPRTGGIALMTTTRLVFAFSNRIINNNYMGIALSRAADGSYLSLGDAVRRAKNYTYQTSGDVINNRKFTLLGDPALTLGFPKYNVQTTTVNGLPLQGFTDTLKALNRYTITGEIRNMSGTLLPDFTGTVYPAIYDKEQTVTTRANDPGSIPAGFTQQQNLVYQGKAKVENGRFSFTFIVPKDIDFRVGKGRISYYADNGATDAGAAETWLQIGGLGNGVKNDGEGPVIKAYLNDEKFVNGGITNPSSVLLLKLKDSSGINTVGTGIGHDITARLDDNPNRIFVLNDFYEAETGSFQSGTVRFPLPLLEPGLHSLKIKVWDVFNNSSEYVLEFTVVKKEDLQLRHVLNYPNPFTTRTSFWFEHNRPAEDLRVSVRIMTITGKVVKTIVQTINTPGNRSDEISWDGKDEFGAKLARGVYLYQVIVRTPDGRQQQKLEKLVIL